MTVKVTKIKNGIKENTCVPLDCDNVGYWVEDQLEENGHKINRGKGVDLDDLGVEVKTRKISSKSAHTVGRMTTQDIVNTCYDDSALKDKIQTQYRVEYDEYGNIRSSKVYDFTDEGIQDLLRESYEAGRAEISQGMDGKNNTKTHGVGIFQRDSDKEQWQWRVTDSGMKKIKTMSRQKTFRKIFEYGNQNELA